MGTLPLLALPRPPTNPQRPQVSLPGAGLTLCLCLRRGREVAAGEGLECAGFSQVLAVAALGPLALFSSPMSPTGFIQAPRELAEPCSLTIPPGSQAFLGKLCFLCACGQGVGAGGLRGWATVGLSRSPSSSPLASVPSRRTPGLLQLGVLLASRWRMVALRPCDHSCHSGELCVVTGERLFLWLRPVVLGVSLCLLLGLTGRGTAVGLCPAAVGEDGSQFLRPGQVLGPGVCIQRPSGG